MLLFVLSTLVVFHFALPTGADEVAAQGLLWVALVFTALLGLGRAWAPEREGGALDGLVLAPSDRSAIWLGKSAAVFAFLAAIELVALPAFALFFSPLGAAAVAGRPAREHRHLRRRHAPRGDGGREPDARADPPAPLPAARDPAGRRRRWGERLDRTGALPRVSSVCTTPSSRYCAGRPLSTSSPNSSAPKISVPALAAVAAGLVGLSIVLAFFVAPEDADQGISQRIFYFHVPIALTAYACFGWGAYKALLLLRTREERYDLESYVAIHQGTIFGALTLATGSIWAKASWGHWWVWDSNQLVLFLVLFLFYCAYFMLRFSIERGPQRANVSAVYALFGVALIPVSFLAIRLPSDIVHPTVQPRRAADDRDDVLHLLCLLAVDHDARLRALPDRARRQEARCEPARAARGADDMSSGEKYVAAAYGVVFVTVLVYVVIIAAKLSRLERETAELAELARRGALLIRDSG